MIEKKYGKFVTLKDIHNLKTRMKNEIHGKSKDAHLLLETLKATLRNDSSSAGCVIVNEDSTLEVFYYQSGLMKCLFKKFSEIMLIDAAYNINGIGMPLYCFMIEDGFGRGVLCIMLQQLKKTLLIFIKLYSHLSLKILIEMLYVLLLLTKISPNGKCLRRNFLV